MCRKKVELSQSGDVTERNCRITVEIRENKRTICYCVLECANALLYIRAGERELQELYAQHSRK